MLGEVALLRGCWGGLERLVGLENGPRNHHSTCGGVSCVFPIWEEGLCSCHRGNAGDLIVVDWGCP